MQTTFLTQLRRRAETIQRSVLIRFQDWWKSTLLAPLEAVLQPSPGRLKAVGSFIFVSQPLIGVAWNLSAPQPYENLLLRTVLGFLGLLLIWERVSCRPESLFSAKVSTLVFWAELPLFGAWMYLCNGGNTEWLVSLCCMILIYYHLTDWRIATGGVVAAGVVAWAAQQAFSAHLPAVPVPPYGAHMMLFLFCWFSAITLGASAANLRREHISNTLHAMLVFAQEMRAPFSTIGAIADKLGSEAFKNDGEVAMRGAADRLGSRLHGLIRLVNNRLDSHVTNAGILKIANFSQRVSAYEVLQEAVGAYPYETTAQRLCVQLIVDRDFEFDSSFSQFAQAVNNLLSNSIRALETRYNRSFAEQAAIKILVKKSGEEGVIVISDNGVGIPRNIQDQVLEPFFTTNGRFSLGLGLSYVERVVHFARGSLRIDSVEGEGTTISIRLPAVWAKQPSMHPVAKF